MDRRLPTTWALGALGVALIAAGCGNSSSSGTTKAAVNTVAAQTTSTTQTPPPPKPHLRIVSPRSGAHTNGTVVVRVALKGSPGGPDHLFHYRLNGGRARSGSAHYTLNRLAPGRYDLVVTLAGDPSVKASRVFVVRAPPPPPPPPPPATTQAPSPATQTQPPPATTTTSSPPPPPPTSSGIPQNNGGDGDADNNGGPSDGDGNV
jgi:hypothetical protein